MYKTLVPTFFIAVLAAAGPVGEEPVDISDVYMGVVEGECTAVNSANTITIKGLGEVVLIGVREASPSENYYNDAVKFLEKRVLNKKVQIEVCPNIPTNDKGHVRAVVYYAVGDRLNVAIELIEEGLARVAIVPLCHVDTKAYLEYEKKAKRARRGLWKNLEE